MEIIIPAEILEAYLLPMGELEIEQIGSGHINRTFLVRSVAQQEPCILQEINIKVFTQPEIITRNLSLIDKFLEKHHPDYLFPAPLPAVNGELLFKYEETAWRKLPCITGTVALDTLFEPAQAYEAAKQFGKLSRLLNNFPVKELKPTIAHFHDLGLRMSQFVEAKQDASPALLSQAASAIENAQNYSFISTYYNSFLRRSDFPDRVMHHDTKISNVLLDSETYEGVCVIDLDTLMPGKFISDLGDMMRTYLCVFSENETDLEKITIRIPYFEATVKGYLSEMGEVLTKTEKELILFSGKYMIYMQALRFLTDYLFGSIYYPASYPEQNLDRAKNQFKLLKEYTRQHELLKDIIDKEI